MKAPHRENAIPHYKRKNPHAAEAFKAKRHATNAARPKQHWVGFAGGIDVPGTAGMWVR